MIQRQPIEHAARQHDREIADGPDAPVEQRHQQQRKDRRQHALAPGRQGRHEVVEVVGEADASARHRKRRGEHDLPDHQK